MDLEARNIRIRALRETLRQRHSVLMSSPNVTLLMSRRDLSRPRMFSANGAASKKAWGIAPGIEIATKTSAEGAFQTDEPVEVMCEK